VLLGCEDLVSLNLAIWKHLDDEGLAHMFHPFANQNPSSTEGKEKETETPKRPLKLQLLNVRDSRITSEGIKMIANYCPDLEVLDLRWLKMAVDFNSLSHVLKTCKKLHSLDIGWCSGADDKILKLIADEAGIHPFPPPLPSLSLSLSLSFVYGYLYLFLKALVLFNSTWRCALTSAILVSPICLKSVPD